MVNGVCLVLFALYFGRESAVEPPLAPVRRWLVTPVDPVEGTAVVGVGLVVLGITYWLVGLRRLAPAGER